MKFKFGKINKHILHGKPYWKGLLTLYTDYYGGKVWTWVLLHFFTALLYLATHCVWLWIWLLRVDKLELSLGKWRHCGSIIVGQTLRCELRVSFADTNVETTSKTSCSCHFALINSEESKSSFTSVSDAATYTMDFPRPTILSMVATLHRFPHAISVHIFTLSSLKFYCFAPLLQPDITLTRVNEHRDLGGYPMHSAL